MVWISATWLAEKIIVIVFDLESGAASGKRCHSAVSEVETCAELLTHCGSGHWLFQSTDKISVEVNEQGQNIFHSI
jgi:hypothetical protein